MKKFYILVLTSIYIVFFIGMNNVNATSIGVADESSITNLNGEITLEQYNANIAGIEKVFPQQLENLL